jgi:outer membrane assembly lipoprotein YfiO
MNRNSTLLIIVTLLTFIGCSSKNSEEPTELLNKEEKERLEISLDTPENQLLEDGKKYFNSELYTLAKQNFESLRTGYPDSKFVDFAEIKIADCLFESGSYSEAAKSYEDFTKRRPTHSSNAYMLYRAGQSQQLSFTGVGRDPTPLKKAVELYDQILRQYPGSVFESGVKLKKKEALELMVAHEQRIQRYYTKKELDEAATARAKSVEVTLVPVLSTLQNDKDILGVDKKDLANLEVPEGEPLELVSTNEQELRDSPKQISKASREVSQNNVNQESVNTGSKKSRLLKVVCQTKESRGVALFFDKPVNIQSKRIMNKDGIVSVQLPNVRFPDQLADCFELMDLQLVRDGTVAVKAFSDAQLFVLTDPDRVFLSIPQ